MTIDWKEVGERQEDEDQPQLPDVGSEFLKRLHFQIHTYESAAESK